MESITLVSQEPPVFVFDITDAGVRKQIKVWADQFDGSDFARDQIETAQLRYGEAASVNHWLEWFNFRLLEIKSVAPKPVGYTDPLMEQRDRWLYEQRMSGMIYDKLIAQLGRIFVARNWDHITTEQAIRDAVNRYIERTGAVDFRK